MYTRQGEQYALDLEAVLININPEHNAELMDACKTLRDYTEYTARVRTYAERETLDEAVEREAAMEEGMKAGMETGIKILIQDNFEEGKTKEVIIEKLIKRFELPKEEAEAYFHKYI